MQSFEVLKILNSFEIKSDRISAECGLKNADRANQMAAKIAQDLAGIAGVKFCYPVEANEIFMQLPESVIAGLVSRGFQFYRWESEGGCTVRLVTAFNTQEADVDAFVKCCKDLL
jgi:threonine aldolase